MAAGRFITDLRRRFSQGDVVTRLLYINVAVFLVVAVCNIVTTLLKLPPVRWIKWFEFSASLETFVRQPWSLFTYMFMHADVFHILFNMLWLYWFGRLFLNFFSSKHLRGLYVLGGVCGGLLYMLFYNVFPYFEGKTPWMLGASASVLAIVVAAGVREPNYPVQFMFIGTVRLKYVAIFMVVLDLLFITSSNAGGHIAHLGGALSGWWFAAGLSKGYDATRWINAVLDWFAGLRRPRRTKKPKMKVHYGDKQKDYDYNATKKEREAEVDRILDKLRKSGYGSLTEEEKKRLFDASKK